MFDPGSKNRLTAHDLPRFGGDGLFDRIARVVCGAECLPLIDAAITPKNRLLLGAPSAEGRRMPAAR
jgi:hypothetical protein